MNHGEEKSNRRKKMRFELPYDAFNRMHNLVGKAQRVAGKTELPQRAPENAIWGNVRPGMLREGEAVVKGGRQKITKCMLLSGGSASQQGLKGFTSL